MIYNPPLWVWPLGPSQMGPPFPFLNPTLIMLLLHIPSVPLCIGEWDLGKSARQAQGRTDGKRGPWTHLP